ncbi:MAG: hypothetical protein HY903_14945 [Deltaproteobacteria bacterium]|nr:hypothetical protein [Deltaproteobacteria bacterium]
MMRRPVDRSWRGRGLAVWFGLSLAACVTERFPVPPGPGSFRVELLSMDAFPRPAGCETAPTEGSKSCPRPFPELASPVKVHLRATVLDRGSDTQAASPITDWQGGAMVDVRPGRLAGVGPAGMVLNFVGGVAETDLLIVDAFGPTRVWIEDCGSSAAAGTFATGVSSEMFFDLPRVDQINNTTDNTTSPLTPHASNVCAISGDPRYGIGQDEDGVVGFVGYSHGKAVNAPPAAMGSFVEVLGCTRKEYDDHKDSGGCGRGPLVVTGLGNEGFFVTDLGAELRCGSRPQVDCRVDLGCLWELPGPGPGGAGRCVGAFNHLYAFNFNYPEDLEVGDLVLSLRGSPVEFAGTTQFSNPVWRRDGVRRGMGLLPKAVRINAAAYQTALKTYGRNRAENLDLEAVEGGLVCFDNLAPASTLRLCDTNESGGIERQGCTTAFGATLPPICDAGEAQAPARPLCDAAPLKPYCFPMSAEELTACALTGYVPENPIEYCCERTCYDDPTCSERGSYTIFGQWVADVFGNYERAAGGSAAVKIAVISRDADPDFDPLLYAKQQLAKPVGERKHVRVIGNLRQVLAARPVWVVIPRTPADIFAPKDDEADQPCP